MGRERGERKRENEGEKNEMNLPVITNLKLICSLSLSLHLPLRLYRSLSQLIGWLECVSDHT